jgi:hypothetical protein
MAGNGPRRQRPERFGSYNDLSPNPYSNSERILDVRNGVLDPYTQIAQSILQNSYGTDTLSSFGNTFRAKILGVAGGRPARHLYPGLYASTVNTPEEMPEYFIFSLRDESDQFAPDPSSYANSPEQHVNMMGLQGNAISEKPVNETIESFGRGDIVEVYKPEQNSWNGAVVRKVVVRNNFSEHVVRGTGAAAAHNTAANGPFRSSTSGGSFTPRLATASDIEGRLGTSADWDVENPGVVYPPGSTQLMELFVEAARREEGMPEEWGRLPGLVGSRRDIDGGGLVSRESGGVVGRLNYKFEFSRDPRFVLPQPWTDDIDGGKNPANIITGISWIQAVPPVEGYKTDGREDSGVKLPDGINSSAIGLGQLLSSVGYANMPLRYGGYGIPIQEARGMLKYVKGRYGHPTAGYSFHNFPSRDGERVYYMGDARRHHSNAIRLEKRDGDYFRTDTGEEVDGYDFILDEAHNRVRYSGFFKDKSASGLIITSGVDEFGRREVKAHEGY